VNWFDFPIVHFLNSFVHRSWAADALFVEMSGNTLLRAGALMAVYWWAWFNPGKETGEKREILTLTLFNSVLAVLVARALAAGLPFRERPLRNPLLHLQLAYTLKPDTLLHWSSFPSDNAVLCFCVAAGLWMVSRRLGALAIGYAALISFDRVFLGIHYPTDVLGGALLGLGIAYLCKVARLRSAARALLEYVDRAPGYFYGFLFVWTCELAEMFGSLLKTAKLLLQIALKLPRVRIEELVGSGLLVGLLGVVTLLIWRKSHSMTEPAGRAVVRRA